MWWSCYGESRRKPRALARGGCQVVKLDFENGKHVAEQKVQQEDRIRIIIAKEQTSFGRNVETVSPSEIIAVSPSYEYDWYKFEDVWDTENDEYNSDT